jgi:hypothetical protein
MGILSWLFGSVATAGHIDGPGFFDVEVVGESNYQRGIAKARSRAAAGETVVTQATLILENDNPQDKQAVRVDISGQTVGYLDRDNARAYRKELKRTGHPAITATCSRCLTTSATNRGLSGARGAAVHERAGLSPRRFASAPLRFSPAGVSFLSLRGGSEPLLVPRSSQCRAVFPA